MVSANPRMNLFEQSPSVLLGDASHENAGRSFAIEFFSPDYHISTTAPGDSFGLGPIFWKFVVEQVAEVRSYPIGVDGEDLRFDRLVGGFGGFLSDGRLIELLNEETGRGDEHEACPRAFNHERTVEIHGPVLEFLRDGWRLDFCPLGDEIGECLRLDGRPWLEIKLEGSELNRPLCNPSGGVAIVKDFTERGACDYRYGMRLEVVHQLPVCD